MLTRCAFGVEPSSIEEWGAAAETGAQWCHPAKVSEASAVCMLLTSRNIVQHYSGVLA